MQWGVVNMIILLFIIQPTASWIISNVRMYSKMQCHIFFHILVRIKNSAIFIFHFCSLPITLIHFIGFHISSPTTLTGVFCSRCSILIVPSSPTVTTESSARYATPVHGQHKEPWWCKPVHFCWGDNVCNKHVMNKEITNNMIHQTYTTQSDHVYCVLKCLTKSHRNQEL